MTLADDFLADFESGSDDITTLQQQPSSSAPSSLLQHPSLSTITSPSSSTPTQHQPQDNTNRDHNNDHDRCTTTTTTRTTDDEHFGQFEFSNLLNPSHHSHRELSSHIRSLHSLSSSLNLTPSSSSTDTAVKANVATAMIGDETVQGKRLHEAIVCSNEWILRINDEIQNVFQRVRQLYTYKFPELETHVLNALDFSRVVLRIGHETDLSTIDMSDILPSSVIMIIRVTSSTSTFRFTGTTTTTNINSDVSSIQNNQRTHHHNNNNNNNGSSSSSHISHVRRCVDRAMNGCRTILQLDEMRKTILSFVSSTMHFLAPNLSAIVGTEVAARLIGEAGGLTALSKIPSADLQLLGKERRNAFLGTMTATTHGQADLRYVGCIGDCDLLRVDTPPDLRKKIGRMIASKCTLAARVDLCRTFSSPSSSSSSSSSSSTSNADDGNGDDHRAAAGKKFRSQIEAAIAKLQEPTQGKQIKPLPAPDSFKKKKRGGKKSQRLKELTKISELQKKKNRLAFGTTAEEEVDQQYGSSSGMGMVGVEGSGTLRLGALTRKTMKGAGIGGGTRTAATTATAAAPGGIGSMSSASIVTTSGTATQMRTGLASSLAFTPVQGIELENPLNAQQRLARQTEPKKRYFSTVSFFKEPQAPAPKKAKSEDTQEKERQQQTTSDHQK